jgi:hypothetical protein
MARALAGLPVVTADPPLLEKLRHGRQLAWADVTLDTRELTGDALLKVVDERGDLAAVLRFRPAAQRVEYGCVFAPSGGS